MAFSVYLLALLYRVNGFKTRFSRLHSLLKKCHPTQFDVLPITIKEKVSTDDDSEERSYS